MYSDKAVFICKPFEFYFIYLNVMFFNTQKLQSGEDIKEVSSIQDLSHDDHVTCVTVKNLFVFMGRELEEMDHIPAGNILGLYHSSLFAAFTDLITM